MALSGALSIVAGGLTATARMAEVVSNNIANAQTEGYGRREVNLGAGQIGGVEILGISRIVDRAVINDRRLADADVGRQQAGATALGQLEQAFGAVGDSHGLAGRLAALEQSLISAASEPASELRQQSVLNRLNDVTGALRSDADALKAQRETADASIAAHVDTLNRSLQQVEDLNADISRMRNAGVDPSAVIDSRQLIIDKIGTIAPIREIDRGSDQVALYTTTGAALIDGKAATFTFNPTTTIVPAMTFAGGTLSGVEMNGQPLSTTDGFGRLAGGALEAAFTLRDTTVPDIQAGLDTIAADLLGRFEGSAVDPTLAPGDPGLLTDNGAALDPVDTTGLSLRVSVNAAVDPAQGGQLSRLRDGIGAAAVGPAGEQAQLDRWLSALREPVAAPAGGAERSAAAHVAEHIAKVSQLRLTAEESLGFDVARQTTLITAELSAGVDTDQELQNLLRIEQAYAANARVMQTIDTMMRRLMEI